MKALWVGYGFALLVMSLGAASAADLVAVDAADPPFMYDMGGRASGLYPALIAEAYRRMGMDVAVAAIPWKRALEGIDGGSDGVGGLYKTESRLEKYDYSDKLFDEVLLVYVRKDRAFSYASIDSLTGRSIGVIRGWSYGDLFDDARKAGSFTVEEASGDAQNFTVLEAGHIDCVIAIREAGDAIVTARHLGNLIEALPLPLSSNPSYVAFNKSAGKREQLRQFDATIAAMRADGSFARITASAMNP